jgi:hypothetical protein
MLGRNGVEIKHPNPPNPLYQRGTTEESLFNTNEIRKVPLIASSFEPPRQTWRL